MNDVEQLYERTIKNGKHEKAILDFISSKENVDDWVKHLYQLEKSIGGVGVHNVNIWKIDSKDQSYITGAYSDCRGIFRAIQYCAGQFLQNFLILDTRYLVYMSGIHIEGIIVEIAEKLENLEEINKPLGTVIHQYLRNSEHFIDPAYSQLLDDSLIINRLFCKAKHKFEYGTDNNDELGMSTHLFSYKDAVLIYFGCRIHGLRLMKWMKKKGFAPSSFVDPPNISKSEFLKVANEFLGNLKRWEPDLASGGKRWLEKYNKHNPTIH